MAKYPDATIQRVETDSDGVYEAHIVTADGEQLIVQVGEDFTITGTQQSAVADPGAARPVPDRTGRASARPGASGGTQDRHQEVGVRR